MCTHEHKVEITKIFTVQQKHLYKVHACTYVLKENSSSNFMTLKCTLICYTESRKRTGGSESGGGVVKKKKALSVSADDPE